MDDMHIYFKAPYVQSKELGASGSTETNEGTDHVLSEPLRRAHIAPHVSREVGGFTAIFSMTNVGIRVLPKFWRLVSGKTGFQTPGLSGSQDLGFYKNIKNKQQC